MNSPTAAQYSEEYKLLAAKIDIIPTLRALQMELKPFGQDDILTTCRDMYSNKQIAQRTLLLFSIKIKRLY